MMGSVYETPEAVVVEHLERFLGPIAGEWTHTPDGDELAFRVAHFAPAGGTAVEVHCTVGLSEHAVGPDRLRLELMTMAPMTVPEGAVPPILVHAGELVLEVDDAPLLGDVFTEVEALADISPMSRLTVARPLYQPPDFALCEVGDDVVAFLWLIPVYEPEAEFVEAEGWEAFEQLMWDVDADPTDWQRPPWL
jgi:hypothetical protein